MECRVETSGHISPLDVKDGLRRDLQGGGNGGGSLTTMQQVKNAGARGGAGGSRTAS